MIPALHTRPTTPAKTPSPEDAFELVAETHAFVRDLESRVGHLGEQAAFARLRWLVGDLDRLYREGPETARLLAPAFAREVNPLLHESSLTRHCHDKPRGYAGDFEAMEMIWRGHTEPVTGRYCGTTTRGKLVNAFTLDSDNCRANVARVHRFRDMLCALSGDRVASVGAGSAIELGEAFAHGCKPLRVALFDQDEGALRAARRRLGAWPSRVRYCHGNVVRSLLKASDERYDLLYSSGMFDYFELSTARRLVARLWRLVAPGGALVITNAHPSNPTRGWMELVADWHLVYKTGAEMRSLADGLPELAALTLERDEQGVYQYLSLRRAC